MPTVKCKNQGTMKYLRNAENQTASTKLVEMTTVSGIVSISAVYAEVTITS
jgi:hypothetical protein